MLDSSLLIYWYLVGDNGQSIVHLHGVSVDDLSIEAQCEVNRKLPVLVGQSV